MSIATAITNLQGRVESAYDKIEERGGILPQVLNTANLPNAIDSIPQGGGSDPVWGITALSDVCQTKDDGVLNLFGGIKGNITFTGVKSVPAYGLYDFTPDNQDITGVSFPDLSSVGNYAFQSAFKDCHNLAYATGLSNISTAREGLFLSCFTGCSSLTSDMSFPNLVAVSTASAFSNAFRDCTGLTSISFPVLSSIGNATGGDNIFSRAFNGCTGLSSISFPSLKNLLGGASSNGAGTFLRAFQDCTSLTSVSFPVLSSIANGFNTFNTALSGTSVSSISFPELLWIRAVPTNSSNATFANNTSLTSIYFPKLSNMTSATTGNTFNARYVFSNCSNLVEIHFALSNKTTIEAATYYSSKWGAPNANCQVYFDL